MNTELKEIAKKHYEAVSEIVEKYNAFNNAHTGLLQHILQYFGYTSREIGGVGLCKYIEINTPLSMLKKHKNIIFRTTCTGYIEDNGTVRYNTPLEISITDKDNDEILSINMENGKEIKIW